MLLLVGVPRGLDVLADGYLVTAAPESIDENLAQAQVLLEEEDGQPGAGCAAHAPPPPR
jgi:hypothetical protein